ncbi:MAG: hypothetical protein RR253_00715, partial [Oscillospiraceae bacterium]
NRPLFQAEEPERFSKKGLGRLGDKKRVGEKGKPQFSATCFIFLLFIDIYHGVRLFLGIGLISYVTVFRYLPHM